MVEKAREPHQKHVRNISTVSDVSMTFAEPLKRDEGNEIRCILLCDSETERHCVFEAFNKAFWDGQSDIYGSQLLRHQWESPHNDCIGIDCRFCIRTSPLVGGYGDSLAPISHQGMNSLNQVQSGFFRFFIGNQCFRLMLVCKDKQNILKFTSYDFLMVGIQVTDSRGKLDENIWEFEWKRLERHSRKAVAPIILFGYFRDILRLGHADSLSLDKIIDEAKQRVKVAGKAHQVIPRFCDFVTGSSSQLEDLFSDINKLYQHPGFVLQQCAYNNSLNHFSMLIENPNLTKEDLCYKDDELGDNPIMIAAKLRHKDLVSSILRSNRFTNSDNNDFLGQLIHTRNNAGQTLLAMVALQGPELEEQKLLILRKEIQLHCVSDITHVADQLKLMRCLRSQLKSSAEAAIILEQSRALQGIPKTQQELKAERGKVWSRLFFASLLLSLLFNAIDTGSDILIMIRYYYELMGVGTSSNNTCGTDDMKRIGQDLETPIPLNCNVSSNQPVSLQCFSTALSPESKFGYTLFFLVVPWPFFVYEFFTSRHYHHLVTKGGEIVTEMSRCKGFVSLMTCYLKIIAYIISFVCCLLFWPIAVLFIKYYNDGKYYLAKGAQKVAREKKVEMSEVLFRQQESWKFHWSRAFSRQSNFTSFFPSWSAK